MTLIHGQRVFDLLSDSSEVRLDLTHLHHEQSVGLEEQESLRTMDALNLAENHDNWLVLWQTTFCGIYTPSTRSYQQILAVWPYLCFEFLNRAICVHECMAIQKKGNFCIFSLIFPHILGHICLHSVLDLAIPCHSTLLPIWNSCRVAFAHSVTGPVSSYLPNTAPLAPG